jgi:hypothetical protein
VATSVRASPVQTRRGVGSRGCGNSDFVPMPFCSRRAVSTSYCETPKCPTSILVPVASFSKCLRPAYWVACSS